MGVATPLNFQKKNSGHPRGRCDLPWATPVVSGHLMCTATLSMSRHRSTLNYLRSVDTWLTRTRPVIYWMKAPAITDSANKCHVFGGSFNQKSLARTLTCDRYGSLIEMSVLSSGDHAPAIFHVIESDALSRHRE